MQTHANLFMLEQYLHHHPECISPVMLCAHPNDYIPANIPLITCLRADSNYTRIHYFDKEHPVLMRQCLKEYEHLLPLDLFIRISRSCIINIFMVVHYHPNDRRVVLMDESSAEISPFHLREFKLKYEFWFGKLSKAA